MHGRLVLGIFTCEIVRLVRDRRALLLAVVLPMLAYPAVFLLSGEIGRIGEEHLSTLEVRVGVDLDALSPGIAEGIREALARDELRLTIERVEPGAAPPDRAATVLRERDLHLLVLARPGSGDDPRPIVHLFFDGSDELPGAAFQRVHDILRGVLKEAQHARLVEIAGADPAAAAAAERADVARPEDTAGRGLGSLMPLLAVLVLISGGSFAALDAFAGEREAGTLETLLVQPVPALAVAWGKFGAVLLTGCIAFLGNAASLFACLILGLGKLSTLPDGADWGLMAGRLALGCALFLPTAVLVCALLCMVSARARSFRGGQLLILPLSLVLIALCAPAMQSSGELGPVLALVPVTGAALALRDAVAGVLRVGPGLLAVAASCAWAWLALSRLAGTLDAERLLATPETERELGARRIQSRRALGFGLAAVFLVYVVGGRMQAAHPVWGLVLTLWVVVPALAILSARGTAARGGERIAAVLGLRIPHPRHLAGALLLAPALARGAQWLFAWQQELLPMPARLAESEALLAFLTELSPLQLFLLLALSPGLQEELLFRGAILSGLARDLRPRSVILWEALLFGAVHASIYRFVPTALLGGCLAAVTLRARSVWPAILLHTAYNAILVLPPGEGFAALADPRLAWLALPGLALLLLPPRRSNGRLLGP